MVRKSGQEGLEGNRDPEVLLEKILSEVRVIAEGHQGLVERLQGMEARLVYRIDEFEKMTTGGFKALWEASGETNKRLDTLTERMQEHVHSN